MTLDDQAQQAQERDEGLARQDGQVDQNDEQTGEQDERPGEPTGEPDERDEPTDQQDEWPGEPTGQRGDQLEQPVSGRPETGDRVVDRILTDLDETLTADPDEQVAAVGEAHRRLQARLSGPAPTDPPRPG